jgi:hypothetical protein
MAKERSSIRVRISHQRMEALADICEELATDFKTLNEHQVLLKAYMHDLRYKLRDMMRKEQEQYLLVLTRTEATAFYQLWNMVDIRHDRYAMLIVEDLVRKMSPLAA